MRRVARPSARPFPDGPKLRMTRSNRLRRLLAQGPGTMLLLAGEGMRRARAGAGRRHRPKDRRAPPGAGFQRPRAAWCRACAGESVAVSSAPGITGAEGRATFDPRRGQSAGGLLWLSQPAERAHAGQAAPSPRSPPWKKTAIDALERLADAVGARLADAPLQQPFKPDMPSGALIRRKSARFSATSSPSTPSWSMNR